MKKVFVLLLALSALTASAEAYIPSEENLKARQEFAESGFGIFLHWGIYSMFGQGEWYLNHGCNAEEYAKAARGFDPAHFDAKEWVSAFKDAGARYVCFTSRHHDGFSMWDTKQSDFNVVDATPYGKDIVRQLADECHKQGLKLHLYYSHLDWSRDDYPIGRTGRDTGRDYSNNNWDSYYNFMNNQLTELLTNYGEIGAIWFDGWWDHEEDSIPFDWHLREQYDMIHKLQPSCLVGNNHHIKPFEGEDIQMFERDLPGQNTAGLSPNSEISKLPLETCETMNESWGYHVKDQNYKDSNTLIRYLVKTAGMGANLLLNIGPQASGELPAAALARLKDIGQWMRQYGETIYATTAGDFPAQEWGTTTRKGDRMFVHVMDTKTPTITLPKVNGKIKSVKNFVTGEPVKYKKMKDGSVELDLGLVPDAVDHVVEITTK